MSELTIEQLIKIIVGVIVVVVVVAGVYVFFKSKVFDFFQGISVGNSTNFFMALIK